MDETEQLKARIAELEGTQGEVAPKVVEPEAPVEPEKPKKGIFGRPKKVQESTEEPKKVAPQEEDRSAFNCSRCKGEGLYKLPSGMERICAYCHGTGKV